MIDEVQRKTLLWRGLPCWARLSVRRLLSHMSLACVSDLHAFRVTETQTRLAHRVAVRPSALRLAVVSRAGRLVPRVVPSIHTYCTCARLGAAELVSHNFSALEWRPRFEDKYICVRVTCTQA